MIAGRVRNANIDIVKGIAILLVVLGHAISGCTTNFEDSILINVIWSLQMPLFIVISGYVTRYSNKISNGAILWSYIKRRTMAYLLPWVVWTFLVRGILFGRVEYFNLKTIFWNMDSGYWFLITIWTISLIFGVSCYLANRITNKNNSNQNSIIKEIAFTGLLYVVGLALLALIGLVMGLSFFCIKLTLYYMPFYFAGYIYGKLQDQINESAKGRRLIQIVVAVSLFAWLAIILRINLYTISDSSIGILIRAFASLAGCIAVCGLCSTAFSKNTCERPLSWCGIHSLEIYLVHYFFINLLKPGVLMDASSLAGIVNVVLNYTLTLTLTILFEKILNANQVLRLFLFGKK